MAESASSTRGRVALLGLFSVTLVIGIASLLLLDGRRAANGDDCGEANQYCPDRIVEDFEAVQTCDDFDALLTLQFELNPYYLAGPDGEAQQWVASAVERWGDLGCQVAYR